MNDFRTLLIDVCESKQIIGIEWADGSVAHGRVVKVGSDYAVFELFDMANGGLLSMPAVRLEGIESINLRPVYCDAESPSDLASVAGGG